MKKIYVSLILVCLFAFGNKASAQDQNYSIPIYFDVPTLADNVIIQDVIMNLTTTQSGVTTNISLPYYGLSMGSGMVTLDNLVPSTLPTSISNAYIVNFLPTQSYITVYNNGSKAVKGEFEIHFNDGFSIGSGSINLPAHMLTTIPLTATMTHAKTYAGTTDNDNITIYYNDSLHQ